MLFWHSINFQIIFFPIVFIANFVTDGVAHEFDVHEELDDINTFDEPPLPTAHTSIHKTIVKHVNVSNFGRRNHSNVLVNCFLFAFFSARFHIQLIRL